MMGVSGPSLPRVFRLPSKGYRHRLPHVNWQPGHRRKHLPPVAISFRRRRLPRPLLQLPIRWLAPGFLLPSMKVLSAIFLDQLKCGDLSLHGRGHCEASGVKAALDDAKPVRLYPLMLQILMIFRRRYCGLPHVLDFSSPLLHRVAHPISIEAFVVVYAEITDRTVRFGIREYLYQLFCPLSPGWSKL